MRKTTYSIFLLFLTLSCSSPERLPGSVSTAGGDPDYPRIFKYSRDLLVKPLVGGDRARAGKIAESDIVAFLLEYPQWINEPKEKILAEVGKQSTDPTKHVRLMPPEGRPGYENLQIFVTHPYYVGGSLRPKDDLIKVWKQFILKAKKEIILNVFDFDLEEVAHVLVAQAKKGIKVQVGIDKGVIKHRPEVKKVADLLKAGGVKVSEVHSVGLNHQKITAIDWTDKANASVLFSSGNLTKSCLEPEGDLKGTKPLPKESLPNANHLITMKSWILSNLVFHELTKTLTQSLRGSEYPLNGSYQITGPGVDPHTLDAYPEPSLIITFAPGGGLKNINKNLIAHIIKREKGPIRMLQFAYSSSDVDEALLLRAEEDFQKTGKFDFVSVGDTPFAMMEWSPFLSMSGYRVEILADKRRKYHEDLKGKWFKRLGPSKMEMVRSGVYVAPKIYGNNYTAVGGKKVKVSSKIHHKVMATPNFAILGTSFNFSAGAETNNEQFIILRDRSMSNIVSGMVRYMVERSPGTVAYEAERRNKYRFPDDEASEEDRQVKVK